MSCYEARVAPYRDESSALEMATNPGAKIGVKVPRCQMQPDGGTLLTLSPLESLSRPMFQRKRYSDIM